MNQFPPSSSLTAVPGDIVFAAGDLVNDGSHPEYEENATMVPRGTRGVVVQAGYTQLPPEREILLVRFEDEKGELGAPIGCWPEEVTQQTAS